MEVWIQPNRLPLAIALIPNALLMLLAAALFAFWDHWGMRIFAAVILLFALSGTIGILVLMRLPRLGYQNGALVVYLRRGAAERIPIDVVECFFLGQADSRLPKQGDDTGDDGPETTTVVVRLAEAAEDWARRDVLPALGNWCEGYITIRGTWCEPINGTLIKELNRKLVEKHRQQKEASKATDGSATG